MDQMDGDGSGSLDLEELRVWYTDFERGGGGMLGEALRKEGDRRFRRFARALLEVRQDGEMSVEVDAALKAVQEARSDPVCEPASLPPLSPFCSPICFLAICLSSLIWQLCPCGCSGDGFPPAEIESLISRCVEEDILMVVRGRFFFDDSVDTRTDIFGNPSPDPTAFHRLRSGS